MLQICQNMFRLHSDYELRRAIVDAFNRKTCEKDCKNTCYTSYYVLLFNNNFRACYGYKFHGYFLSFDKCSDKLN